MTAGALMPFGVYLYVSNAQVFPWGGYPQAERCRLCLGNTDVMTAAKDNLEEVLRYPDVSGVKNISIH
jgi:hypothetical protein